MKSSSRMSLPLHAIPALMLLATASVSGQIIQLDLVPGTKEVPAAPDPAAPAPGAPKPGDQPEDLGQALRTMTFDRSPDALLAATRAQRQVGKPTPVYEFKMAVMLGDWAAVGKALASLPPADGAAAYTRLLESLATQSIPVGDVLKAGGSQADEDPYARNQRIEQDRAQQRGKPAPFLSEDFYSLVEVAPGGIKEEHVAALTKLVQTALGEGGRATLVTKLATGWKGLGGTTPEGRKLATRLLSSLGWIKDAAPFLPLKKEEWEAADPTQLVFAMEYFTQIGIAEHDERQLQQAAELCAWLMKTSRFGNYTRPQFRLAMDRLVLLLPALDPAEASKLIREQLFQQTATLADLITIIGELGMTAAKGTDLQARKASLGTQRLILDAMVEKRDDLPANTAVLVMNWLTEAEACYRAGGVGSTEKTQAERMMIVRYGMDRKKETPTLTTTQILDTAPPAAIIPRLNPGLAQRVELTLLKVNILRPEEANLDLLRAYVKSHPGLEREVCQDVLAGWVNKRTKPAESDQVKQMRAYGMYIPPQMLQAGSGIPLTRLRQNQNIEHFKSLLAQLRGISPAPLDPALIVEAFMALHSGAEVYRIDDIEAIFGPPEKMVRGELLNLVTGMRARLGQQWRDPQTQQAAATNRTEKEAKDEVSRGYHTAITLLKRGIPDTDTDWMSFIVRGQLFFDASQYEIERQVKLADYINLRDEAFGSFRKAAAVYATRIPSLPRGQWSISHYQSWFLVMLGASDLSQLTSNVARTDPGLKQIGDAIRALPDKAADAHLEMFAKMLGELFPQVPPNIRQRFLKSGLQIVGENHPAASAATASLRYYTELLDEIRLHVEVDGPTRVGHGQPFGAFISLEATRQLLRESGGFSKYLQNQAKMQQAQLGGGGGGGARDLRDDFAKNIHAALDETFEVISLTFHDSAIKTIDLPRDGWVESPLIYAVLRAKSPAVDRIPSIQLDMDFIDQPGLVVLPVMSQVQPIDARDASVSPRPCADLAVSLTMDQREWKDGKVAVDVLARGQGVLPNLDQFLDCQRAGFDLETVDTGLSVSQYVSNGKIRLPQADRNWQLVYKRKPALRGDVTFPFPTPKPGIKPAAIEYKTYKDADLVTVDAAQAAAGVKLAATDGSVPRWLVLTGLAGALVAGLVVLFRRKKPAAVVPADALVVPATLTPFSTIAFLRRLRRQHGGALAAADRASLDSEIRGLEARYFSNGDHAATDLSGIISKWLHAAGRQA